MKKLVLLLFAASLLLAQSLRIPVSYTQEIYENSERMIQVGSQCSQTHIDPSASYRVIQPQVDRTSIGLDTVIGAVAGVAIGNQFHNNRGTARAVGGLVGAGVANSMRQPDYSQGYTVQRYDTTCRPIYERRNELILVGYKNCALYNGRELCSISNKPEQYILIYDNGR